MGDAIFRGRSGLPSVATPHVVRQTFGRSFIVMFPDALSALGRDGNAGALALRVLTWAWANLSHDAWDLIDVEAAALDRLMSASGFRKGMVRLLAEGILEAKGKNPRKQYRITPVASWRGGTESYQADLGQRLAAAAASAQAEQARPKRARRPGKAPAKRRAKGKADGATARQ